MFMHLDGEDWLALSPRFGTCTLRGLCLVLVCSLAFAGFRFLDEVIVVAVRWYLRYSPSYRTSKSAATEGGIDAARFARHSPGDRWYVDETYVKVNASGATSTGRRPARPVIDILLTIYRGAVAVRRSSPGRCAR
jgi:transposase-like protein